MANEKIVEVLDKSYDLGFKTDVQYEEIPVGINEDIIRLISAKKEEPNYMLEYRLKAYHYWKQMEEPNWADISYKKIDYNKICYLSVPKKYSSLEEVDPKILETYEKLGIPLGERAALAGVAVDAVFDSVSVVTTFREKLAEDGIIFCSISDAIKNHSDLIQEYLGSVVPYTDNFFAALNAAVFTDGSFVYIPPGVKCPMELSTYFRINAINSGQFERTLIIACEDSYVSYLEGCSAVIQDSNQLHAAVVELIALDNAKIKYSTVQNWYPGDEDGNGGIYNFVTKRGDCKGKNSNICWTQIETGSAITWKYPSVLLRGENSVGEFYSIALTNHYQQADTGTKMIHLGKNTKSTIISKGISTGNSKNTYRGLVRISNKADYSKNYTQCDSLILSNNSYANTYPYIESKNNTAIIEHEATTSKISEEQLLYCQQRGLSEEEAVSIIVNGFCKEVIKELPMEFAVEAQKLLSVSLEGSIG